MRDSIHPKRLTRSRRLQLLTAAALMSGILAAGCGGSSRTPTAATVPGGSTSATSAARSRASAPDAGVSALAFARCMRANGVPNFPDPNPGGGFSFPAGAGVDPYAPAVKAAQTKCQNFMPDPLSHGPAFSAQSFAKVLRVAHCMRQHGIPDFPDPSTTRPSFSPGISVITDYDGAYLAFPASLDMQSPAYKRAASACGALAQKLGNGPH